MRFGTFFIAILSGLVVALAALLAVASIKGGDGGPDGEPQDAVPIAKAAPPRVPRAGGPVPGGPEPQGTSSVPEAGSSGAAKPPSPTPTPTPPPSQVPKGSSPLSRVAFIKRGDAICAGIPNDFRVNLAKLAEEREAAGAPKPSVAEITTTVVVPPLQAALEELGELVPPSGDEREAGAMVAALEKTTKRLEESRKIEFGRSMSPFADFQRLTREYGFKVCSKF